MSTSLYRKYRPQTFGEVSGQEHITKTLQGALSQGKVGHAYLFAGPRGTGKTTTARILAKAVNCQVASIESGVKSGESNTQHSKLKTQDLPEPCNKCESCLEITAGRALDVIEIDAASTRGIDDVRELREKVKFAPSKSRYKVFIIDEVHMLTKEAWNALLKTLEEPPAGTIFVLATTELHKVPETIVSRCQKFDFKRIGMGDIIKYLEHISKQEKIDISKDALELIAAQAGGAHRDAISLLDQARGTDAKITKESLMLTLGIADFAPVSKFASFLLSGDAKGAVGVVEYAKESGYNLEQFLGNVILHFRNLLGAKLGGVENLELTTEQVEVVKKQAGIASGQEILEAIKVLLASRKLFPLSPTEELPLEVAVWEICENKSGVSNLESRVDGKQIVSQGGSDKPDSQEEGKLESEEKIEKQEGKDVEASDRRSGREADSKQETGREKVSSFKSQVSGSKSNVSGLDLTEVKSNWTKILDKVKAYNHSLRAFLRESEPVNLEGDELTLRFSYKFHMEKVEDPENKKRVSAAIAEVLGKNLKIKCEVGAKNNSPEQKLPAKNQSSSKNTKDETLKKALEIFGGEIVE